MALRIGALVVDPPLFLAPMAGVTDRHYRLLIRRIGGVGMVAAEFVSSVAMTRGNEKAMRMMTFVDEERPVTIQIYGSDVEAMAGAAEIVQDLGPDACDINMGCPANKVLKGCAGAALMGDLDLAKSIIGEVRRRLKIPLTVKFRLGLDTNRKNFLELGRICQGEGVNAVAMHARTARQMYGGEADWEQIRALKETLSIPVIGNGDVRTPDDALRLLAESGCDGVMIGRGSMKNPWIFRQIAARLAGSTVAPATLRDRRDVILEHFRMIAGGEADPLFVLHKIRTFTGWYTHGLPHGRKLRQRIGQLQTAADFLEAVEHFFADLEHQGVDLASVIEVEDDLPRREGREVA